MRVLDSFVVGRRANSSSMRAIRLASDRGGCCGHVDGPGGLQRRRADFPSWPPGRMSSHPFRSLRPIFAPTSTARSRCWRRRGPQRQAHGLRRILLLLRHPLGLSDPGDNAGRSALPLCADQISRRAAVMHWAQVYQLPALRSLFQRLWAARPHQRDVRRGVRGVSGPAACRQAAHYRGRRRADARLHVCQRCRGRADHGRSERQGRGNLQCRQWQAGERERACAPAWSPPPSRSKAPRRARLHLGRYSENYKRYRMEAPGEFSDGVAIMRQNMDYWRDAPVWTQSTIADATSDWFKFLGSRPSTRRSEGTPGRVVFFVQRCDLARLWRGRAYRVALRRAANCGTGVCWSRWSTASRSCSRSVGTCIWARRLARSGPSWAGTIFASAIAAAWVLLRPDRGRRLVRIERQRLPQELDRPREGALLP